MIHALIWTVEVHQIEIVSEDFPDEFHDLLP